MVALIGFMPEDLGLSVVSKDNPLTSMSGPERLDMVALPLPLKAHQRPKLSSKTVRMDLVMSAMLWKSLENIQLVSDSMINISQDLLTRYDFRLLALLASVASKSYTTYLVLLAPV